jgi:hypothetical protein
MTAMRMKSASRDAVARRGSQQQQKKRQGRLTSRQLRLSRLAHSLRCAVFLKRILA